MIMIEENRFEFLKGTYFNFVEDNIVAASRRAYRDMNRTLRLNGANSLILRDKIDNLLKTRFEGLKDQNINGQDDFDECHKALCDEMISICTLGNGLTYGQAQKWLNMTVKYIYIIQGGDVFGIIKYAHIPLDNYIFKALQKNLGLKARGLQPWSKISNYNKYLAFQKEVRDRINGDISPLEWELDHWIKTVRNSKT
ncbi:hypothetical protein [Lacticaseibacillus paracasei]|uniref:hypothetical protein n=1 Tax=Lacticaseibacillus paracasei TaxID=1597 RepID=UPI0036D2FD00